jgi:dipeptidyl aminopeptidase/acylaminoacyl peptidase
MPLSPSQSLRLLTALSLTLSLIAQPAQRPTERPIELKDVLGWKRIHSAIVSNDGVWFAYRLSPNEGDSEIVLRNLKDGKETRFAIGEAAVAGGFGNPRPQGISFSEDSRYLAFQVAPKSSEAKKSRKDRKTAYNKLSVVELATGKSSSFDKVKAFSFSGDTPGWLALHKYTTEAQDREPPASKFNGSDLLLHHLPTADELNIGNVAEFAFNKSGSHLALLIDAAEKSGNGIQLRDMKTGALTPLDSAKASYKSLNWTDKGDALAALKGYEDKAYEEPLYRVVGVTLAAMTKTEFNPAQSETFPKGLGVSGNRRPTWTEDLSALSFGIAETKAKSTAKSDKPEKPEAPNTPDTPDMLVWHYKDKRLAPMQVVQERMDKNFSYLSLYYPAAKRFVRLADESMRQVTLAPKDKFAIGRDNSAYELQAALNGQRYEDIYVVDPQSGAKTLALSKQRYTYTASPTGTHFLYYNDGHFFAYDMRSRQSKNLTQGAPVSFIDTESDTNVNKPPTGVIGWTLDGSAALIEDNWDIWRLPIDGKPANLTVNGRKEQIRYQQRYRLDPEEKGIDLTQPQYLATYGEWTKKGGIALLSPGKSGVTPLLWDDAAYGNLMKAKSADTYLFTKQSVTAAPDYHVSQATLANAQKVTSANPQQKDFLWSSGSQLVDYICDTTNVKSQAALFLPANYEPGKKYPAVVYIYEKLSQEKNRYGMPALDDRFNRSVYNSNGYAVIQPDITYKLNDPGRSALWCVVPALKAAIASGIVDPDRVGLHGHSWGGYETSFLITQTNMFKTAIAGAPLTDLVSMYSSVYWNTGSSNQSIFESSQGRFTSGYMDNPDPYIRNSPVYHAQNVKTPLMILHNDKDGAVDFTQGIEYFNTLRRLQKPVVMLQYKGENHHLAKPENSKDFLLRMKEYYDHHLKGAPAPKWLDSGVPLLELKDEVEARAKTLLPAATPAAAKASQP